MSLSGGYRWGKRISKKGKKRTMLSKTRALKSRKKRGTKKKRRRRKRGTKKSKRRRRRRGRSRKKR
tara:strand:- start:3752 stop:3949 length:198 start_codon:yes stop_codon:yes gene_type:complete